MLLVGTFANTVLFYFWDLMQMNWPSRYLNQRIAVNWKQPHAHWHKLTELGESRKTRISLLAILVVSSLANNLFGCWFLNACFLYIRNILHLWLSDMQWGSWSDKCLHIAPFCTVCCVPGLWCRARLSTYEEPQKKTTPKIIKVTRNGHSYLCSTPN